MGAGGGGGFLRSAAAIAAGIAGGALLFQGIESLFGQRGSAGILGGQGMTPGLGESVVNNYYGDAAGGQTRIQRRHRRLGGQDQDFSGGSDPSGNQDFSSDQDFSGGSDPGNQDFSSDQDFSGGDFGGSDNPSC